MSKKLRRIVIASLLLIGLVLVAGAILRSPGGAPPPGTPFGAAAVPGSERLVVKQGTPWISNMRY